MKLFIIVKRYSFRCLAMKGVEEYCLIKVRPFIMWNSDSEVLRFKSALCMIYLKSSDMILAKC
jgi:hypothetical protein